MPLCARARVNASRQVPENTIARVAAIRHVARAPGEPASGAAKRKSAHDANAKRSARLWAGRIESPPMREEVTVVGVGAPGGSRTHDLWLRRPTLYPAELRARISRIIIPFYPRKSMAEPHPHHSDVIEDNIDTHPVKLAIGVAVGAIALVLGIIMLAQFAIAAYGSRSLKDDPAMSPDAVKKRLAPVARLMIDPNDA